MRRHLPLVALLLLVALVGAACSGDDGDGTTTTAVAGGTVGGDVDSAGAEGDSGDAAGDSGDESTTGGSTTTTAAQEDGNGEPEVPEYTIVNREPGEDEEGDTVVVLLDPDSYGLLTDIDLQNVVSEVVDDFPPVYTAYVIDSEQVADLVLAESSELTPEDRRLLELHHLVTLEEGFRITFLGAFEESGTVILGS